MAEIEADKIVFKPMSYEELSISLERLQRFNHPFRKFDRVYREILIKHIVSPKISLKNYYKFSLGTINRLVQLIWNESVKKLNPTYNKENYSINAYLIYEEIKEFSVKEILKRIILSENISGFASAANFSETDFIYDENILKDLFEQNGINFDNLSVIPNLFRNLSDNPLSLKFQNEQTLKQVQGENFIVRYENLYSAVRMNYPINIDGFLQIAQNEKNISKNIKRLIWLNNRITKDAENFNFEKTYKLAEIYRNDNCSKKPLKMILLVEGITEEILLPIFSEVKGIDFHKRGIEVVASGGKNQVARIYEEINQETNLPIFIILDSDAQQIADEIRKNLRPDDRVYLISGGEFEDILPDELICRSVNTHYKLTGNIKKEEISIAGRKTDSLVNIWKQKGFGEFKKAEFAHIIAANIKNSADLSEEMQKIISNIHDMLSK